MLAIDHIVIVAHNPEQAAQKFEDEHSVKVIQGGKHDYWGTYNYLAYFDNNSYIEWIGLFDRKIAAKSDNPLIQEVVEALDHNQEGIVQYALRTENMDGLVEHFSKAGISFTGPIPGSRNRPDGSTLEWRMLFPQSTKEEELPFLIEWGPVKNTPSDRSLINSQQITSLSAMINNMEEFSHVFQLHFDDDSTQLSNTELKVADKLTFSLG
ncbi:VOC family protein [Virgibacillus kekensis]|uniref:VOC family protein n=1 Tax=Virgibacillus kekensis TaxID=202261 RepID=A0ABV9DPH2_9BACI